MLSMPLYQSSDQRVSDTSWDHWFVEDSESPIFFSFMMKLGNADNKGFESVTSARLHLMKNKE